MELPNYSKQLLLHLHTLCKEQQFCDCTIFIGSMNFRAHKLILAAASLLFKSLLDETDTLSIDSSVVTADEFTLLLQIVYTGKLPPGKHNLTKVISVADTLQMFDVAVSCKKLLTDLMNRSNQNQLMLDASGPQNAIASTPVTQASKVQLNANDGRTQEPMKVLGPPGEVPYLSDTETSANASELISVDMGSGKLAAIEALRTMSSSETFATDLVLEDTRMKNSLEIGKAAGHSEMQHVASEHLEKIFATEPIKVLKGPSQSEAAITLAATEVASGLVFSDVPHGLSCFQDLTCSATIEAVSALTQSQLVSISETSKEFSSPASIDVVMNPLVSEAVSSQYSSATLAGETPLETVAVQSTSETMAIQTPSVTVAGQAPSDAVVDQTPSEAAACQPPSKTESNQAPSEVAADSADSRVVAGLPSETMTCSKHSQTLNGSAVSEQGINPTTLVAQTNAACSVTSFDSVPSGTDMGPSENATRKETSRSVTDLVSSRSFADPVISGNALALLKNVENVLAQKTSGAIDPLSDVERSSLPLESIVALTLAELEAGGAPAESHSKPVSVYNDSDARQSMKAHQTILERKTQCDSCSAEAESSAPPLQTSSESSDNGSEEELEPPMKKGRHEKSDAMDYCSDLNFLLRYERVFAEVFSDIPTLLKLLSKCLDLEESVKQVFVDCCQGGEEESAFKKILEKVKNGQTVNAKIVVRLLDLCRETHPKVKAALLHREKKANEPLGQTGSPEEGKTLFGLLLEHREDLVHSITELSPIIECLDTAEDGFLSDLEKKVIIDCCTGRSHREAVENLLKHVIDENTLSAESLVKLLHAVKEAFPDLCLLLEELESQVKITAHLNPEEYGIELLRRYHENLAEILTDPQVLMRGLAVAVNLAPREREVIKQILNKDSCMGSFASLASAVLEERTLSAMACWQVVLSLQEAGYPFTMLLEDIHREPDAELFFQSVVKRETVATEMLLRHSTLITQAIKESNVLEPIAPGEEWFIEAAKEVLSILSEKEENAESPAKQFLSSVIEKSIPVLKFCQMLCSLHESCPNLQPLMQELEQMGLLTGEERDTKDIRKWKVNNEDQIESLDKTELNPKPMEVETSETDCGKNASPSVKKEGRVATSSKKSYVCKYCKKIFLFRCRLVVHVKRCRMALEKAVPCPACKEMKASKKELERHMMEAHSNSSTDRAAKARKKRVVVTCDICGKEFAHPSGMQYHKRTEHFDEKPFSCSDCGAKFAANSTLKNHLRLHTGERPYMCKHCHMTFTQAAALAYHTKKKHCEGKMYTCQYCDAVFAQSIELTRHVRTHTGDKPYVCRECGKGFSQANGLAIHLRTFHNIDDPYDCQKCRMSFSSLDEHRKHIQEIHFREYHPCPTCSKIFSAPSLLERHMVIHVGGKPYNCEICDKAYQQLSGLWYHNRTHHPDIFAAQNHRSAKFTSLLCIACDRGFSTALCLQKHVKEEHADMKLPECDKCQQIFPSPAALQVHMKCKHSGALPFQCLYCTDAFRFPGALQHHVATEHFSQTENTFGCELCGELFTSQALLQSHYELDHPEEVISDHPEELISEEQATSTQVESSEQVITMDDSQLGESQLIVAMPDSQESQNSSGIVAVSMKDLLEGTVTLICGETK